MSETKNIYQAMIAIMGEIEAIGKDKTNPQQGYKFRGIDDMYNAIHPLFKKHGVFITSNVAESKREERQTAKGGALIYTIAKCEFTFHASDGSSVTSTLEGEAMDSGDKSTNKAMSAALKYALMQMFLIPTEEKLDTEYDTHEVAPRKVATKQPAPAPAPQMPIEDVPYWKHYVPADEKLFKDLISEATRKQQVIMLATLNEKAFTDEIKALAKAKVESFKPQPATA